MSKVHAIVHMTCKVLLKIISQKSLLYYKIPNNTSKSYFKLNQHKLTKE